MADLRIISRKKRIVMPLIDFFGKYLFEVLSCFNTLKLRNDRYSEIRRILISRLDSIGDVVLSTPILKPLKMRFPRASITYLLSHQAKDIIKENPYIDEIIFYDAPWHFSNGIINDIKSYLKILNLLRRKKFDLVLDLEGNAKNIFLISYLSKIPNRVSRDWTGGGYLLTEVVPWDKRKHMIEYQADIARAVGVQIDKYEMLIPIGPKEREFVDLLFSQCGIKGSDLVIALSPGARRVTKFWPRERFAEIGDWLVRSYDAKVVITGSPNEIAIAENVRDLMGEYAVILAGKTRSLKHLAVVMERASLVIGNDSGPMHISAAVKTPTVTLFSSGLPSEYRPYGNIHKFIQKGNLSCRPCTERKCVRPEGSCMELITVEDVKEAVKEQMKTIIDYVFH